MRRIFPFAYSLPAGHLDVGEKPEVAAIREVWEETGIPVDGPVEHMGDFDITTDSCRRGCDDHVWHLYRYMLPSNDVPLKLNDEATEAHWLSLAEIQDFRGRITPAFAYIIERFKEGLVS